MNTLTLSYLVVAAGIGQLLLDAGSLAIPRILHWREETSKLSRLTRQVFWTYAGYVWAINLCLGLLSVLAPGLLLDQSPLAGIATAFITVYWGARLAVQLIFFGRADKPKGLFFQLAEAALVGLFIFLPLVYGAATAWNMGVIRS